MNSSNAKASPDNLKNKKNKYEYQRKTQPIWEKTNSVRLNKKFPTILGRNKLGKNDGKKWK